MLKVPNLPLENLIEFNLLQNLHQCTQKTVCATNFGPFGETGSNFSIQLLKGAQWLSGRVLDSRPKGRGFEPHRRHCVVVLEQDTFILA